MATLHAVTHNRKLYIRLLLSITLCIVLTLLVSSLFYFFTYTRIDLKKAYESDLSNLQQTSREVISMTESAQALSFQIYRTFTISKLLFYTKPNIYDETAAMTELNNYLNSIPFIESIYVYNSKNGLFYTARRDAEGGTFSKFELSDKGILDILDNFQQYRPFSPIPRTYGVSTLVGEHKIAAYTYLGYDAIGRAQTINSAVIVNISAEWMNKGISATRNGAGGASYILDNQSRLLLADTLQPKELSDKDRELLQNKVRDQDSSYVVASFDGEKSLISFTAPDSLDWQYVRVTPYSTVTKAVYTIRNNTMLIAIIILLAGLLVSWLLSRVLYRPIHQIVDKVQLLENERRNSSYTMKQTMLRNLIQGKQSLNKAIHVQRLAESGITLNLEAPYRVVLLKIDRFDSLKEQRGDDMSVYKFAVMNISGETCMQHYRTETIDIDEDSIVMLMNRVDDTNEPDDALLRALLGQVQQAVQEYLKLGLSITYSPETAGPSQLRALYRQVKEASKHRLFYGWGSIIDAQAIAALKMREYVFPGDKERKMTDALMTSKTEEAKKLFEEIVRETADYPIHVMQLAISHLTMTINNVLHTLYKNNNLDAEASASIQMPSYDRFETVEELCEVFFALFDDIQVKLSSKRTTKQSELVRRVNDLIHENFDNAELSLNWIADKLDMSSVYLSRMYKQQTMNAIVDVINTVRLEKSMDYLENSTLSVADIAQKSGYMSSSYFHRMFKKNFGVTPSDYRKLKQAEREAH